MGQELRLDGQAGEFPLSDRFAETGGIPVDDDGGKEVEAGHAVVCKRRRENVPGGRLDRPVVAVENCTTRCLP